MLTRRARNEDGAVAIIVALLATLLLSIAALTVDLGAAFVQKRVMQQAADLSALSAGAGDLPAPSFKRSCAYGPAPSASDQAVIDVAKYLSAQPGVGAVTAAQLVDCDPTNGEVVYGSVTPAAGTALGYNVTPDLNKLTVLTPQSHVAFNFAAVMGIHGVNVDAQATVALLSPSTSVEPLYAYTGCDWGRQTIAQPNNGHALNGIMLAYPNDTNAASLSLLSPTSISLLPGTPPTVILTGLFGGLLTSSVTDVGFFEDGGTTTGPAPTDVPASSFTINTPVSIALPVPAAVSSVQDVWYIRVKIGGSWSAVQDARGNLLALPLTVGVPLLMCGQGSSSGNFGTLDIPNTQVTGKDNITAMNIAAGTQVSLAAFQNAADPWTCASSLLGAILSGNGTNCVSTATGMSAQAAQMGFISGVSTQPGRLARVGAGTGCAANGQPATTTFGGVLINNDTLSCFFTDNTTNVGDIDTSSYNGPQVISPAIFQSPRFVIIPVLGTQPASGKSQQYEIVGFRAGFITDQDESATKSTPPTASNGITGTGTITSVEVVFINPNALPPMAVAGLGPYNGSGLRTLQLVN